MTLHPRQPPRINIEDSNDVEAGTSNNLPGSGKSLASLDVVIPAHLLQTANTVSKRDEGDLPNWEPQRQLSVRQNPIIRQLSVAGHRYVERPNLVQRSSTLPSGRTSRAPSPVVSRANSTVGRSRKPQLDDGKPSEIKRPAPVNTRHSWRLSYTPGVHEELALSPRVLTPRSGSPSAESFSHIEKHASHDFANHHLSNPFADKHAHKPRRSSSEVINPFLARNNSASSFKEGDDGTTPPEAAYMPRDVRQRRGTLETIVNAVVPDALQRKLSLGSSTAGGLTRQSSMRKTFEQAKIRGQQLQRNKWAMLAFEWGIYLLLTCFIYFVLIGIPLWNGAVWWLYWVVANKFVFAGGFSITLGIALL